MMMRLDGFWFYFVFVDVVRIIWYG